MNKFSEMLFRKVNTSKSESDFAFFFSLLIAAEALTKIITLQILAALDADKDRHKYKILHNLVRTSGIGDWSKAIDELLIGTASQYLNHSFRPFQAEMTKKVTSEEWQYKSIENLNIAMNIFGIGAENLSSKVDLKSWFKLFTELRNKTRGHGAIPPEKASAAAPYLECSIKIIIDNLKTLSLPTAYLKRNLSGKYRVTPISEKSDDFQELKSNEKFQLENGVYIFLDGYKKVPLIESDADLYDFYIANGGFNSKNYELLSYVTDNKKHGDSSPYLAPKGKLPSSESEGIGQGGIKLC